MMNLEEQLQQINTAINAIMSGSQEYRIGNRSLKRPDLNLLLEEKKRLENSISSNDGLFFTRFEGR